MAVPPPGLEHCAGVAEVMGSNPAEHTWTSSGAHVRQSIKFFRKCEDHSFNSSLNRACQTFLFFPFSFPEIRHMNNSQLTVQVTSRFHRSNRQDFSLTYCSFITTFLFSEKLTSYKRSSVTYREIINGRITSDATVSTDCKLRASQHYPGLLFTPSWIIAAGNPFAVKCYKRSHESGG